MSFLAIGAVTKALADLLEKKLNKPPLMGPGVTLRVTTLAPDDQRVAAADGVNLFLYRVVESPFAKNVDWRGDRANPVGVKRPPLALTLHYMLTAYARESDSPVRDGIMVHQILGNAAAILHEHPVLNDVHDSDFDANLDTQFARELRDSFEKVKISMTPLSMDEFSKIWTGLSKAYRLSVGFEVSLVQIAPILPAGVPAPLVQQLGLTTRTLDAPVIASLSPPAGPAGASVTVKGHGFKIRGMETSVQVGDITLAETDLTKLTAEEIVLTIPEAPLRGPKLGIVVSVGGRDSVPGFYEVQPWINTLQPLRGKTGIPITIPFDVPSGATVSVEVDGQAVPATIVPQNKLVRATVPTALTTNGPRPVVLILNNPTPQRSNARFFEVLPVIQSVAVTTNAAPPRTTITITGQRLDGKNVHVRYGALLLKKGENNVATQLVVEVQRLLPPNQPVSAIVDNRESNAIPPGLEHIEPPEAFAGGAVTLIGKSLSGQSVTVRFGATNVVVGPHAYASQLPVRVPLALAPGTVQVRAIVDGNETNDLSLRVLA